MGITVGSREYHEKKACNKKQPQQQKHNNNNNNNTMDIPRLVYSYNYYIVIRKMK